MGMFDYVRCEYPLPDGYEGPLHSNFQTKSFDDPYLETYVITADGRLLRKEWHLEKISDEPKPESGAGITTLLDWRARTHRRIQDPDVYIDYHGDLEFYSSNVCGSGPDGFMTDNDDPLDSREYIARFSNGRLERITGGADSDIAEREASTEFPHITQEQFHTKLREARR